MLVTDSIDEIRNAVKLWKREKLKVGFVPTMGALHEGHLSLIREARKVSDRVVVSIFVNPEQFGPDEDFEEYPRQLDDDIKMCRNKRVAAVFTPGESDLYPGERLIELKIDKLNEHMCGASRQGFFEGVLVVVNKLFNIVQPDLAIFGQKDIQQFQIVKKMTEEFNQDVKMIMGKIVRANDGLALSSRNVYLDSDQRTLAPSLYRSLKYLFEQIKEGVDKPALLIEHQKSELEAKGFEIDYLNVFSMEMLQPVEVVEKGGNYIIAGAVYLGETRLIDNMILET